MTLDPQALTAGGNVRRLEMLPVDDCLRIAKIMGPQSACARAVEDYQQRTEAGERVGIYRHGGSILVGPLLPPPVGSGQNLADANSKPIQAKEE